MQFNFDISDTRNCLLQTEELLRDFASAVLSRQYGLSWESIPQIGWSKEKKTELNNRQESKKKLFPHQSISSRLIDYSYIGDIKYLISKNKKLFSLIIKDWDYTMFMFDILNVHRNNIMHHERDILKHQLHLCLGVCGEFMLVIQHWKEGYSRQVVSYSCDIMFLEPVESDVEAASAKALLSSFSCLKTIRRLTTVEIRLEKSGNQEFEVVTTLWGEVKISNHKTAGQSYRGRPYQGANIHVETDSFRAINLILKETNLKYWTFRWVFSNGFDVGQLEDKVREITGRRAPSTSGNGQIITGASYYIFNDEQKTIRVDIAGSEGSSGQITLVDDSSVPDKGFVNAHNVFSPDLILSIIYGETAKNTIPELVKASYS